MRNLSFRRTLDHMLVGNRQAFFTCVQFQDLPQTPRFLTESLLQNGSKSDLDALLSRLPSFDHSWSAELKQEWFKWVENLYMVYKRNNKGTD